MKPPSIRAVLPELARSGLLACALAACSTEPAPPGPTSSIAPTEVATEAATDAPRATGDERAIALAERVLERLGGRAAWERARYFRWHFFGTRKHYWDRHTGDVRIESGTRLVLMNVNTREGRAFEAGVELTDVAARSQALEQGYAWWVNDSYWMFMPYKLLDPGVHLAWLGERELAGGGAADAIELTFDDVGLTPKNRYEVLVAKDTGLVAEWIYQAEPGVEPVSLGPWAGWQGFGEILLAGDHGRGADWEIAVYRELPGDVFLSPAPTDA